MIVVVVDTNVFVSALLGGHTTRRILNAFLDGTLTPALSPLLMDELTAVLQRPAIQPYLHESDSRRLAALLKTDAIRINPTHRVAICRDPKDDMLLECALAARADAIVTGDNDLLTLHPFHRIPILSPQAFITRFLTS